MVPTIAAWWMTCCSFSRARRETCEAGCASRCSRRVGAENYERARELRDALRWLERLEQPVAVEVIGTGDADAIGFARDGDDAVAVLIRVRDGRVVGREHRFLEGLEEETDPAILSAFLVRYYVPAEGRSRRVVMPFPPEDWDALRELLPEADWIVPQRGTAHRWLELADHNARHLLESLRIESFETEERAEDPVYALGRDLGLTSVPRSLVCIDISHNQGKDTVGSLVWFEAGRPKKSEYRKFKIEGAGAAGRLRRDSRGGDTLPHAAPR